jgi:hypothetical protein
MIFRSSIYTAIIIKLEIDRLIKTHRLIILDLYHSFMRYSLSQLYHIGPDYFSPYNDNFNFIEYISRGFDLNTSGIFNHSWTFI